MRKGTSRSSNQATRYLRSQSGNVAIIAALFMPVVTGFCWLATDLGHCAYRQCDLHAATDIASRDASVALDKRKQFVFDRLYRRD